MDKDLRMLRSQQLPNKLYLAGADDYDKVWIRDNAYIALALIEAGLEDEAAEVLSALLGFIRLYEDRLDRTTYPVKDNELIHPRFTTTGGEVDSQWSNKQHDAIGILLFAVGRIFDIKAPLVSAADQSLCQKLVRYLERCHYWNDTDNGMWEEEPKLLHSSSLAAAIAGIEAVSGFCEHDKPGLAKAKRQLAALLPAESTAHPVDMAQLSLLWPFGYKKLDILADIEHHLLRRRGVIRYEGDIYESLDGIEPDWVMGIPWLGIAHFELGDIDKARKYLATTDKLYTGDGGLPESYRANNIACAHTPLAWSHAMTIVLRAKLATVEQAN